MSVALADVAASASPRARARRGVAFGRFCRHRTAARAFCKKGRGCLSPQGLTLAPDAGSRIVSADVARCLTEPCSDCGGYCAVTESAISCSALFFSCYRPVFAPDPVLLFFAQTSIFRALLGRRLAFPLLFTG